MPHVIRLREPWEHTQIPGGTRHARSFNWLADLQPGQQVWLVIDAVGQASVVLNGSPVGQASRLPGRSRRPGGTEPTSSAGLGSSLSRQDACPTAYEIASLLAPRNEIVLELTGEQTQLGEARLEIDDPPSDGVDEALRQSVADADGRTRLMRETVQSLGKVQP